MSEMLKFGPNSITVYEIKKLLPETDKKLNQVSEPFDFTKPPVNPIELANNLFETMLKEKGFGLSAIQIGLPYRVFVVGYDRDNKQIFFNPELLETSEKTNLKVEGCLSNPGLFMNIKRPDWIKMKFQHVTGEWKEERYDGITARVILHEYDHLSGKSFPNMAPKAVAMIAKDKREKTLKKMKRAEKKK